MRLDSRAEQVSVTSEDIIQFLPQCHGYVRLGSGWGCQILTFDWLICVTCAVSIGGSGIMRNNGVLWNSNINYSKCDKTHPVRTSYIACTVCSWFSTMSLYSQLTCRNRNSIDVLLLQNAKTRSTQWNKCIYNYLHMYSVICNISSIINFVYQ